MKLRTHLAAGLLLLFVGLLLLSGERSSRAYVPGTFQPLLTAATFSAGAVNFNASPYMSRGANLTGIADGKQGIFSVWVNLQGGSGSRLYMFASASSHTDFARETTNTYNLHCFNTGFGSKGCNLESSSTFTASGWHHILGSWDASTTTQWMYIDDASATATTNANVTINYATSETNWAVGALPGGTSLMNGYMAEMYFNSTTFLDLSVTANRRKFISALSKPVDPGPTCALPTGSQPIVCFHHTKGAAGTDFATNRGSGGNFTITGTLNDAPSAP